MDTGRFVFVAAVIVCLFSVPSQALYEKDGPVTMLTQRSFSKVLESNLPVVVEFFAPWCGHCKALAPAYTRAAEKLKGIVPFVAVDCDADKNRALCGQYGVQGFPTIKLLRSGSAPATDYQGERSAKALVEAATSLLSARHVTRAADDAAAGKFLSSSGPEGGVPPPRVLLFGEKKQTPPLFKSLATRFHPKLSFAEVAPSAKETASRLGVTSRPTLLVVTGEGEGDTHRYTGELKAQPLIEYLKGFVAGAAKESKAQPGGSKAGAASRQDMEGEGEGESLQPGEEDANQGGGAKGSQVAEAPRAVKNVTLGELEGQVLTQDGVFLLGVFAGDESSCAPLMDSLNQAVQGLGGLVKAVQLHLGAAAEVEEAGRKLPPLREVPLLAAVTATGGGCERQVFLLPFEDKDVTDDWVDYEGEMDSKALQRAALELFPSAFVTPLGGGRQEPWMLQSPTKLKVILFSDKEEVPGVLRALSCNFRPYHMEFGLAPAGDEVMRRQFNVPKIPYMVVAFPHPSNAGDVGLPDAPRAGDEQVPIALQPYDGPLRYAYMARFLQILAVQLRAAPAEVLQEFLGGAAEGEPQAAAAVPQLRSQSDFQQQCLEQGGICIIAALPMQQQQAQQDGEEGAQGEAEEGVVSPVLAAVRAVAVRRAVTSSLHFMWLDSARFARFASALGVPDPRGAPSVVALAPRKQRYALLPGTAVQEGVLNDFVEMLLAGKVPTAALREMPEMEEEASTEDQEGAEPEVVEEEFDLADIMNEEVEGELGGRAAAVEGEEDGGAKKGSGKKKKKKGAKKGKKSDKDEL